jgi:hypothetical protein
MNAALRKEVRLLMPAFIVALVTAAVPVWVVGSAWMVDTDIQSIEQISFILFAAGALLLSLSSFGLEMSLGTFPSLLAQPRPRLDIWQMKIGLLAAALASVVLASGFSWWFWSGAMLTEGSVWPDNFSHILLLAVMAFAGGLWTTLLFRQMVAAFWFAIVVPVVLYSAFSPLERLLLNKYDTSVFPLTIMTLVYAVAGYCLARWLFLHAQDKEAIEEATDTGAWSFLPAFPSPCWPVAALLVKELRLQQGTLLIGVVLLLLHLSALAVVEHSHLLQLDYFNLRDLFMLWMVLPLVVGCASFAEERRCQTLQSTLCLPVGLIPQFVIKLMVVFGLGIFLGAGMPLLLAQLHSAEGPDNSAIKFLVLAAATITAVGCYASSLSGALLQAIGAAIGLFMLSIIVAISFPKTAWAFDISLKNFSWPVLIATCLFLSYGNFKQLRITWRQWLRNGLILLAVIFTLGAIASYIYS